MSPSNSLSYCAQWCTREGNVLSVSENVPTYCAVVSKTATGSAVCNRGCDFSAALGNVRNDFVLFPCPFGVSCGALLVSESEASTVLKNLPPDVAQAQKVLVGGRGFASYSQFRAFMNKAIEAGADMDALLDGCKKLTFESPAALKAQLEAATLQPVRLVQTPPKAPKAPTPNSTAASPGPQKPATSAPKSPAPPTTPPPEPECAQSTFEKVQTLAPHPSDDAFISRAQFDQMLLAEMKRSERFKHLFTLAFVRLNMEQWPGDQRREHLEIRHLVLQGVESLFLPSVRIYDMMACIRDATPCELFGFIFPETDRVQADAALRRVLAVVQDRFLSQLPRQESPETALFFDVGVAEYPVDGLTLKDMKSMAWTAMEAGSLDIDEAEFFPRSHEVDGAQLPDMDFQYLFNPNPPPIDPAPDREAC